MSICEKMKHALYCILYLQNMSIESKIQSMIHIEELYASYPSYNNNAFNVTRYKLTSLIHS